MRRWVLASALALGACVGDHERELSAAEQAAFATYLRNDVPADIIRHEASFGGSALDPAITLVGYLLRPRKLTQRAGKSFRITFVWKVSTSLPRGFRPFTHLVDADGRLLLNADSRGPLRAKPGSAAVPYPASAWPHDRYVLDSVDIPLPADAPPKIRLWVGWFHGGSRLVAHGDGADPTRRAARIALHTDDGAPASVPSLEVPWTSDEITIDGRLEESAWDDAGRTGALVDPATGRVSPSPVQGSARVMYDEEALYVAFEVTDANVTGGFAPDAVDPHLWTRDTVEIMLDPDGDGDNRDYYEIQIGPQNLIFDSRFDSYNAPRTTGPNARFGHQQWSANAKRAVVVHGTIDDASDRDGGYVVEAKLPFASFAKAKRIPPKPGDSWRANFYVMENNGGVAWSPILGEGNFHKASRFGRLSWGAPSTSRKAP